MAHFQPSAAVPSLRVTPTPEDFCYHIVIPSTNVGKVRIPDAYMVPTSGSERYKTVCSHSGELKDGAKDFALCLKFLQSECKMGDQCHQLHVSPSFFQETGFWTAVQNTCCIKHGDYCSRDKAHQRRIQSMHYEVTGQSREAIQVDGSLLGYSLGLEKLLKEQGSGRVVTIPHRNICRLHGTNQCRYGGDCGRVHICREFANQHIHTTPLQPKQQQPQQHARPVTPPLQKSQFVDRRGSDSSTEGSPGHNTPELGVYDGMHGACFGNRSPSAGGDSTSSTMFGGFPVQLRIPPAPIETAPGHPATPTPQRFAKPLATPAVARPWLTPEAEEDVSVGMDIGMGITMGFNPGMGAGGDARFGQPKMAPEVAKKSARINLGPKAPKAWAPRPSATPEQVSAFTAALQKLASTSPNRPPSVV